MIKLIVFDLDGVITDTKHIHFEALNDALSEIDTKYVISYEDHLSIFDGLKTSKKLEILTIRKGLPKETYQKINARKQEITIDLFSKLSKNPTMIEVFKSLRKDGYMIGCCTNSIARTAYTALASIGVLPYIDLILTNDDVKNCKPHPEIYWKIMSMVSLTPEEVLIVEDSPKGLASAYRSGASVLRVDNPSCVSYEGIINEIKKGSTMKKKWTDKKLNILIPMAGAGSRFEKAGYSFPKPLIDVKGKPMIQIVVEGLGIEANYIYVVQSEHKKKYNLETLLNLITPGCSIIEIDGVTDGAARTTLLAKNFINNDNPLIITNSDQFVDWDSLDFMYVVKEKSVDGAIVTFKSTHPKWSFAKVDGNRKITEVAEKNPISTYATAGIYYWKHGKDYVISAEKMIAKNIRTNNEFYVCPVYNEAILDGKFILNYPIKENAMWGLGTPEDLNYYLNNYKNENSIS